MADERIAVSLAVEGAREFQRDFLQANEAVGNLTARLQAAERIRTPQLSKDVGEAARAIVQLSAEGKNVEGVSQAFLNLAEKLTGARVRTSQLREEIAALNTALKNVRSGPLEDITGRISQRERRQEIINTGQARAELDALIRKNVETSKSFADLKIASEQAQAAINKRVTGAVQTPDRLQVAIDAAKQTAEFNRRQAEQAALSAQGFKRPVRIQQPEREVKLSTSAAAEAAAVNTLQGRLQSLQRVLTSVTQQTTALASSAVQAALGLKEQGEATDQTSRRSITYLSVLSAIHAASFLATNQTFSMIGSFATLGAAFGKMGLAAGAAGLALGGLLGLFGVIQGAIQQIQTFIAGGIKAVLGLGAAFSTAAVGIGAAGVKIASDVESQLASVRAFGGATADQLKAVEEQAGQFARQFGISAASVVEATSIFARAGGTVEEAIQGATEAIVRLQIASKGELDAAQAATVLSAALRQFDLDGTQAVRVADNLTAAFQGSALSATGVQQAFIQAAPGAAALGISLEDLSAGIALIGDRLVKGTITGTAFKQFLLDIINPTEKAKALFQQYGVAIKDAEGNIRPLIDILDSLNQAFGDSAVEQGKVAAGARDTAIATIFGSRAFLAAQILTRGGADALEKYRAKLNDVTTSNIVSVLMLPLNRQLEVARENVNELGRVFGGPLLQPIRNATVQAIAFFQGLLGPAQLLGQAISAIATGQGFGQLQANINALVSDKGLANFFIELANTLRNVRDVLVSQIVPAFQTAFETITGTLSKQAGLDQVRTTFDGINVAIQRVGATISVVITNFGKLVAEMITNTGVGAALRNTIEKLATSFLSHLAVGVVSTVTAVSAAIQIMPTLARVALITADAALKLAGAFKEVVLKFQDVVVAGAKLDLGRQIAETTEELAKVVNSPTVPGRQAEIDRLMAKQDRLRRSLAEVERQGIAEKASLTAASDAAEKLGQTILTQLSSIDGLEASLKNLGKGPTEALATARKSVEQLTDELIKSAGIDLGLLDNEADQQAVINRFRAQAIELRETARRELGGIITIFDQLEGEIPDSIANIIAQIEEAQRQAAAAAARGGSGGVIPVEVDTKAIEAAQKRIAEVASDASRRLGNIQEDSEQKALNTLNRALERMGDITEQTTERITDVIDQAEQRVADLFRGVRERREDRQTIEDFRQAQDDRFTEWQRELDKEDVAHSRSLDRQRTDRQRDNEDKSREKEQEIQDNETVFQRLQDAAQRAFDRVQQAREVAFSRAQDLEATNFQRSLEREATARDNARQLAQAKTPEDRAKVIADQQQARQDLAFRQGQEDRLTTFRQGQEDKRRKFAQDQETQGLNFRISLEERALAERRKNELILLAFRRNAEDRERSIRETEEDKELARRLAREDIIQARRLQDQKALQAEQDRIEDIRNRQQAQEIINKAIADTQKDIAKAEKQINEIIDSAQIQLAEQGADAEKQIRNVLQTLEDLKDNFPPEVLAAVMGQLVQAEANAVVKAAELKRNLEGIRAGKLGELQLSAATATAQLQMVGAEQTARLQTQAPIQQMPVALLAAQTIQAQRLVLPPGFAQGQTQAFLQALRLAEQEGVVLSDTPTVDLLPLVQPLQQLLRFLGR